MPKTAMHKKALLAAATLALCALSGGVRAQSQAPAAAPAELSGTYQCRPNPEACVWPGASPSIAQSGKNLQIKGDNATADAVLTSDSTISAGGTFNSLGIIRPDHSIDWSDGTKWSRQ